MRLTAELARKDLQARAHPGGRVQGAAKQEVHLAPAFGVLVREVHPGEGNVPAVPARRGLTGLWIRGLGGEWQTERPVMAQIRPGTAARGRNRR